MIRRAIFAYHYENDCAKLEEFDDLCSTASTGFDLSLSTSCRNNSPPFSPDLIINDVRDEEHYPTGISNSNEITHDQSIYESIF